MQKKKKNKKQLNLLIFFLHQKSHFLIKIIHINIENYTYILRCFFH